MDDAEAGAGLALVVRKRIRAAPSRVFAAWLAADALAQWWRPPGGRCRGASLEPRVGGRYRIDNELPDGRSVVIHGELLVVDPPRRLAMTFGVGLAPAKERVTVRFEAVDPGETEVVIVHEGILNEPTRAGHSDGWHSCLDGLAGHFPGVGG